VPLTSAKRDLPPQSLFHVKRQLGRRGPHPQPERIVTDVRSLVQRSLEGLKFDPPVGFLDHMQALAALLALWGSRMNLTARPDDATEVSFQVVDSLMPLLIAERAGGTALNETFAAGSRILDLGSGAGFPGLVLAAACGAHFTLCESRRKRASFLRVAIADLDLRNVTVESAHVQPANFCSEFDGLTVRAVGSLPETYRIAASALRRDGIAILYATPNQPIQESAAVAAGFVDCQWQHYQINRGAGSIPRALVIWRKA
jgi:16S rRNA (guanine527-N7)-methyltransferase